MKHEDPDIAWNEALRTAIDWSILLADDPQDDQLRARFEAWRKADPLHEGAWRQATNLDDLILQVPAQRRSRAPIRRAKWGWRPRLRHVFAGACLAAMAWIFTPVILLHARADIVTDTSEQAIVRLEDGSIVRLAPGSALRTDVSAAARQTTLLAGEAFFDVAPDPTRPFRVAANGYTVTVLGTGFNVRIGERDTDVAVRHGQVRVERDGDSASKSVLAAGQWLRLSADGSSNQGRIAPDIVGSWSSTRLVAVDRPLPDVIDDLRRYYAGRILLLGDAPGNRTVTGVFDTGNPADAAALIVRPHGGTVRKLTPWLLIVSLN